jgi:predicted acetyltransferase
MQFRQALPGEIPQLFQEGYKVWSRNRTFEQYSADNGKEDCYGTRYVIEDNGGVVSSLILLRLNERFGRKVYGIGSVLTPPVYKHRGYATKLLEHTLNQVEENAATFLYSEVAPAFYERFYFRVLPSFLQKDGGSICMVRCTDELWEKLQNCTTEQIPAHF